MSFWKWFSSVAERLDESFEQNDILEDLDREVGALGPVVWELGPGVTRPNALVISPNGDPEVLSLSQRIVSMAPSIQKWEFASTKPPKPWPREPLRFGTAQGEIRVDIRQWEYILAGLDDGTYELVILARNLRGVDSALYQTIGVVVLDLVLGEEKRLTSISSFSVRTALDKSEARLPRSRLEYLGSHLEHLSRV